MESYEKYHELDRIMRDWDDLCAEVSEDTRIEEERKVDWAVESILDIMDDSIDGDAVLLSWNEQAEEELVDYCAAY